MYQLCSSSYYITSQKHTIKFIFRLSIIQQVCINKYPKMSSQPFLQNQITLSTNDALVYEQKKKVTYFLPAYVRFLIKEIDGVDLQNIQSKVSGTLLISIHYGEIPDEVYNVVFGDKQDKQDKPEKCLLLEFNQQESLLLKEGKGITKKKQDQNIIQYTIRQTFQTDIKGKMFWAPFNTLNLYLLVVIQSLSFNVTIDGVETYVTIKCNCMDNDKILLLRTGENLSFGINQIACNKFEVKYSNSRKYPFQADDTVLDNTDDTDEQKIKYFQYAHFKIGIFQHPEVSLLKVFIPLWMLGLMGLAVYFQEESFGARLATISVIALAYISLIDTINNQIPPSPKIKLTEIFILMQLLATILLLFESFQVRNQNPLDFIWDQSVYFMSSFAINVITFLSILGLLIRHRCFKAKQYTTKNENDRYRIKQRRIIKADWSHKQCDKYFRILANNKKIYKAVKLREQRK